MAKIETKEILDANDEVVGYYDVYSHLRRIYCKDGQFQLADGRRYNLAYKPKYSRNIRYFA